VLERAHREIGLVEVAAIRVERVGFQRQRAHQLQVVVGAAIRRNPGQDPRREDAETDAIAAGEVPLDDGGHLVDRDVERRKTRVSRPELARGVEQQPDDVALVTLVFTDQEHPASRRGFPGDAFERIAGLVLAQLAQIVPIAEQRAWASGFRAHAAPPPACGAHRDRERLRQHFDAERIGERERNLE
jgi:hypothetical protein